MRIAGAVAGALIVTGFFYGIICLLNEKYALQLKKKNNLVTDKAVLFVGIATFALLCCLGVREGVYHDIFLYIQNLAIILAMSVFAVTDAKVQLIPNRVLLIFGGIWVVIDSMAVLHNPETGLYLAGQSLLGGFVGGIIFLVCYILSKKQLGAGDVKLSFVMGLFLTGQRIIGALAYGILLCCLFSLIQVARKKLTMKDGVPLVPFLYMGTLITYLIL